MHASSYVAFHGDRRIAAGPLADVLPVLKQRFDRDPSDLPLVFETLTGSQVDFDLRGTLEEVLERAEPVPSRGRGRPRLGVTSREVSLLPRHWSWLEAQPSGSSAALRRLVERAAKDEGGRARARDTRAALSKFLSAMAGNRPNFEEACRALFAGQTSRFELLIEEWPRDIRDYAVHHAAEATRAESEQGPSPSAALALVNDLYRRIWTYGDYAAIERLVAPRYVIHSDPGDPWEGKTLDHEAYRERVRHSRSTFPDLVFQIEDSVAAGDRVAVRWRAEGTHEGDLPGIPATLRRLVFSGQTFYAVEGGRVAGHWQAIDRLGFFRAARARA